MTVRLVPRTLYGKLVAALLALICGVGLVYVVLTVFTTRLYQQEVNQGLNRTLAAGIVGETWLLRDRHVNRAALEDMFHELMVINPSIEVYLVDPDGAILAFNAPPGKVQRERISLAPVRAFLAGADLPIRGDDPRDAGRSKIFSAAPIQEDGRLEGYLYVVLGGEAYDSVVGMLQGSYIVRLSAGLAALGVLLAGVAGVLLFNLLTRRLRRLSAAVERFKQSDFRAPVELPAGAGTSGDEIDQLGYAFAQMSQRITDQIEQLRQADAARREMVASVSHDLRTPLASLQGYLETLQMKQDALSEEQRRHYLELALRHGERLGRLIGDLFELATLETGGAAVHVEPFSMGELMQDVSQKFRLDAERRRVRLETSIAAGAPFVAGDIGLIERVLENLIENAIKYSREGGIVRLSVSESDGQIATCVADSGCGIAAADLPHIFERFYRAHRHRPGEPEGTGLGLAIADRILRLHGRPIEVDSAPGRGSAFTFRLPASPA